MRNEKYVENTRLAFRGFAVIALIDLLFAALPFPPARFSRGIFGRAGSAEGEAQLMIPTLLVVAGLLYWGAGPLARWCWRGTGSMPAPGTPERTAWAVAGALRG